MKCKYCGGDTIKAGMYKSKRKNTYQLYLCKECKRRFARSLSIYNLRHPERLLIKTLKCKGEGMTPSEIRIELNKKVPTSTIEKWCKRYYVHEGRTIKRKIWTRGYWAIRWDNKVWIRGYYTTVNIKI